MKKQDPAESGHLHENTVKQMADERVFVRGVGLCESRQSLVGLHRLGTSLRGWCWGSDVDAYRVGAEIYDGRAAGVLCSCPYEQGGICKHAVALLLRWCRKPDDFAIIPPMEELIQRLSPARLALILRWAAERDPRLLADLAPNEFSMPVIRQWDEDEDCEDEDWDG